MKKQLLLAFFALAGMATTVCAQQPGTLDANFNGKGIKTFSFIPNVNADHVTASYLQPDGKLLVAMTSIGSMGTFSDTTSYIARFLADGKEDPSFGVGGKKDLDANFLLGGSAYFIVNAIALQNDGTIVLGGVRRNFDQNAACIVSLKADGSFNELFANGTACVVFSEENYIINTLQIHQKTGNIWACAGSPQQSSSGFLFCCLTRTGQTFNGDGGMLYGNYFPEGTNYEYPNSSVIKGDVFYVGGTVQCFDGKKHYGIMAIDVNSGEKSAGFFNNDGGTGTVTVAFPAGEENSNAACSSIRFAPDSNSIFLAGTIIDENNALDASFMLTKINLKNGGDIDQTFSGGTKVYRMDNTNYNYVRSLAIEPNGKMMLAGTLTNSLSYWTALKLLPNGNIDQSFGSAGRKVYDNINSFSGISGLHYNTSSQKYLLVGHYMKDGLTDGLAKRINSNGDDDNSYGTASEKIFYGKDENTFLRDIAVRSDGKMVVGGSSRDVHDFYKDAVALLNADGSQDNSFGGTASGVVFLSSVLPALEDVTVVDVEVLSNNKILVAGQQRNQLDGGDSSDFFVVRLNENGTVDPTFGTGGYVIKGFHGRHDFFQGMTLQGNDILLYGYGYNAVASQTNIGIMRISAAGVFDASFGTGGFYFLPGNKNEPDEDILGKDVDVKVQKDGKIVGANYKQNTSFNSDMAVFRLSKDGIIETAFGGNNDGIFMGDYGTFSNQRANALYIDADDRILVGGYTTYDGLRDYAILRLLSDGTLDATFANAGWLALDKGFQTEMITYLTMTDNKIVAIGFYSGGGQQGSTALRLNAAGIFDNTFAGKGYTVLHHGLSINATTFNNKLYTAGIDRDPDGQLTVNGLVSKMNLGTGPVIKTTNLQVSDYNKILGDAPFLLPSVSNSSAVKTYSISSSGAGCVTVHPTTGLITMTCATVNSSPITVRVIQPAIIGFTADTAYSIISVAKGIPEIVFNPQGDTLNSYFEVNTSSNSDAFPQFNMVGGNTSAVYVSSFGAANVYEEGCVEVEVYYSETSNYLAGSKTASICGYVVLVPPAAFDDNVNLTYPVESAVSINPLINDEAYTGTINPTGLDLDPSTEGIQRTYVSSALGKFEVDTLQGIVIYTPFQGFVGSGSIDYVVYDSKGSPSPAAKILVNVNATVDIPELKATELFTPNNDGLNDAFVIGYVDLEKENQLKIFDRNGAELFTKNNYNNDWNGELSNGKQAENGIYYYIFTESNGDKSRELKGVVELKR